MKIPRNSNITAAGLVRRWQKKLAAKAVILMYHRIAESNIDPWRLCVTPENFAAQLMVLQKYYRPVSLNQLVRGHQDGRIPDRSVVVTFDDGYADNLNLAKPLLEKYQIPATIFISMSHIGKARELWWDELEQLLLRPGKLPAKLTLNINQQIYDWDLGSAVDYSPQAYQQDRLSCQAWTAPPGSRLFFYYSIWQVLLPCLAAQRERVLDEIAIWTNTASKFRQTHRTLDREEVRDLGRGELVEIGAHTLTHPLLSAHDRTLQWTEIHNSKLELEALLARPVTSFSYPFGDRSTDSIKLATAAGFNCACSTQPDVVWQRSNCFDLPRCSVENWSGREFADRLAGWFD
jgi:peptidoglycan/xylan/chitin deacetylase (PgdA/CDA1 family)